MENVEAFGDSRFPVTPVNTAFGFPQRLAKLKFQIVVLHYSLFQASGYRLEGGFREYLEQNSLSYKVTFFQDEHHYCRQRFDFLNRFQIELVYTLLEPENFHAVYGRRTPSTKLVSHLPGYVSDALIKIAQQLTKPDSERCVDIGYRARRLPAYMGKGAREKYDIGFEFRKRAASSGLQLDIALDEHNRIYGKAWYSFLANCVAVLGVESGVSIFDVDDVVRAECERLTREDPSISDEDLHERVLRVWEGNIPYRTISPRHFEAAALRVCQILFEGEYSGIMRPMIHYIPLKKDFSNFDEVITMFQNSELRTKLTENAYRDLIGSGRYSYQTFIDGFDQKLLDAGFEPNAPAGEAARVLAVLSRETAWLRLRGTAKTKIYNWLMRTQPMAFFVKPALKFVKG